MSLSRRHFVRLMAVGAIATVPGCESQRVSNTAPIGIDTYRAGWPLPGHDGHNTGFNPDATPVRTLPEVAWEASFDADTARGGYSIHPRPAVVDGRLYLGGRRMTAYGLRDGDVSWERSIDRPVFGTATDGERLYAGAWDGFGSAGTVAFDLASGEHTWTTGGDWSYAGPPVAAEDFVLVPTKEALVVLSPDGEKRGSVAVGNPPAVPPAITEDAAYYLGEGRTLAKYPVSNGPSLGSDGSSAEWTASMRWGVSAAPAFSGGTVFAGESIGWYPAEGENDARLRAFRTDGTEQWSEEIGATSASPAVADGTVYALTGVHRKVVDRGEYVEMRRDGVVRAFDASDGAGVWERTYPGFGNWRIPPVVAGDVCYAALNDAIEGAHKVVAIRDGTELWSRELPAPAYHLAAVEGLLVVTLFDGSLLVLQ